MFGQSCRSLSVLANQLVAPPRSAWCDPSRENQGHVIAKIQRGKAGVGEKTVKDRVKERRRCRLLIAPDDFVIADAAEKGNEAALVVNQLARIVHKELKKTGESMPFS